MVSADIPQPRRPPAAMSVYDRDYMRPSRSPWNLGQFRWSAFGVVFWLNISVFVCQYLLGWFLHREGSEILPMGGVSLAALSEGRVWTLFTYMFVHGDLGHLLMNMLMLWFVGRQIQQIFGGAHFIRIYLLGGLLGAALEIAVRAWFGGPEGVYLVGASASVFGLFLALAVTLPQEVFTALIYFIIPVRVRMWKLAAFAVGINLVLGLGGLLWDQMPGANVAYFAHLGGALTGWYYIRMLGFGGSPLTYRQLWSQQPDSRPRPPRSQFELVPSPSPRRRLSVDLEIDHEAARKRNPSGDPAADVMQEEVDPILDKISEQGLHSLTPDERRTLERASRLISRPGRNNPPS
jgi:membrane associated rhomboid family serine protease